MIAFLRMCIVAATALAGGGLAQAQEQPGLLIVLDGSGSMWGQVDGRTKIDLAREALSQVLSEATPDMQIGMLAYGHRARGQCSDIEVMVPSGPAPATVPGILEAARRINPLGMTPLSEAVMQAAQRLRFTEQAATVVLLTDGVETCGGDPCALGRMLAQQGIDFTAHVVGFDMTDAEQRTVSCLATETGGMFLAANDADDLARALHETILATPVVDPGPVLRPVSITLRDTHGGEPINGRQINLTIDPPEGGTAPEGFRVTQDQPVTATGDFLPGRYTAFIRRDTAGSTPVSLRVSLDVPEGTGPLDLDIVIGARLRLVAMAHAGLPMPEGGGNLPFAAYGSSAGRAFFVVHPVIDGAVDLSVDYGGINSLDVALPPGEYFIRGGLSRSFSRERLVRVLPGEITESVFDFEAARVFVDMRDAQGFPVERQSTYFYDAPDDDDFLNGGGRGDGGLLPFYLPVGTWRVDTGATGGGARRAQSVFTVTRPGEDITLSLREGDRVDDAGMAALLAEGNAGCIANLGGEYGCLVEAVGPADYLRFDGIDPQSAEGQAALAPRFAGSWLSSSGPVALVQDGRRVWGDVPGGVLSGEVAADGLTMRGIWDDGLVELRLAPDGLGMTGRWGRGLDPALGNSAITARRITAGAPPLVRATGTDSDLPEAYRNGASTGFEAFMVPVRGAASGDLDQMQADAQASTFGGVWSSSHQALTLHQQGRRVWGERTRGVIEGEVSADGRTLRGTWTSGSDWGTLEFVLDASLSAFTGRWGRGADADLRGGSWSGSRQSHLPPALTRAETEAMARPSGASGAGFEAFMQPVRDGRPPASMPTPVPASEQPSGTAVKPAAPDTAPVAIGTIDVLPIGVFAAIEGDAGEPVAGLFDRILTDSVLQGDLAMQCASEPTVIYPDGMIAGRALDPNAAAAGGDAYETYTHEMCEQNGPILSCARRDGAPEDRGPVVDDYNLVLAAGPRGTFALSLDGAPYVFRSCYGQGGFLSATETAPDGQPRWQHVVQRRDGGPGVAITPAGDAVALAAPLPSQPDFEQAVGIWARGETPEDLATACFESPGVLHPDGVFHAFAGGLDEAGLPTLASERLACASMAECRAMRGTQPAPGMQRMWLEQPGPDRLQVCQQGSGCRDFQRCDPMDWSAREQASGLAARWQERVMARE